MSHSSAHDDATHADDEDVHAPAADGHDEPIPDEPKTPLWLTALGGGLFFLLAVAWLAGLGSEPAATEATAVASANAAAAPPTPPAKPPPPLPPPAPPPIAAPPPSIPAPPAPIPPANGAKPTKKPGK